MFTKQNFFRFVALSLVSGAALAASVPHTFTSGTPAVASEVNDNFSALVAAVTSLEARLTALETTGVPAPTMASVAGTYDVFEVSVDVDDLGTNGGNHGFGVAGSGSSGTIVFNSDGSGQINITKQYRQLNLSAYEAGGFHYAGVQLNDAPETNTGAMTWTFSNGVVTAGDTSFVVAGPVLIGRILSTDGQGHNGIIILVRRL
jgi:hypothetical protein